MRATRIFLGLFVALLALTACDGTTPQDPLQEPPPPAVLVLEAVTPVSTTGIVGEELVVPPVVLVTQEDGLPVEDVWVSFRVSGSGLVGSANVMTDAAGQATPGTWRLGRGAGPQKLTARAAGLSLVFVADAQPGPISSLAVVGGNGQWATAGTPLPAPLRVKATDGYGNIVTDAAVTFAMVDGGGSLEPGASITGADGIAESRWTLGTTAGRQHVRAQAGEATAQLAADACPGPCSSEVALVLGGNIVIFDAATGATRQLTIDGVSHGPAWSPDGERMAFARSGAEGGIYVMKSDGIGATRVTGPGYHSPTWSPQGDALAFSGPPSSCPGDQYCGAIYVQELSEGSVMRQLAASASMPAWSPDGSRIAFVNLILINDEDNDDSDLHPVISSLRLVNIDGSGLTEITPPTSRYTSGPTWSPDGTRIAFSMGEDIYVVSAEGTDQTRLTTNADPSSPYAVALTAAWSPDGTRIAYTRGNNIMQVPAEGGEPTRMTSGSSPSWRP